MKNSMVDSSDDLFADLFAVTDVNVAPAPVVAPAVDPPAVPVGRSVLDVLDAQHVAMAVPLTRSVFLSFLGLLYGSWHSPDVQDVAEAAGVDMKLAQKHLTVLEKAELLTVCKYTGSVSINRMMFQQFKDWVLGPYVDEMSDDLVRVLDIRSA
ncbi:hypothetical protein SAMN04489743_2830 [Pseudarthrobacter equi]|uniref:Uncharacterized protein n=1 Tax=Pseudarthrobacter equi TaxID=728066 RepID=A0A1H2A7Q0_9MICC|nr:hypothetical protein [Pseudarthrobacter equi]SDT41904.1 hypothetical protein SAMN04489743_2830 [Pseudarthrobacter equi]